MTELELLQQKYNELEKWAAELEEMVYPPQPDGPLPKGRNTLREALECCWAWEPDAYLMGNLTSKDLALLFNELEKFRESSCNA
jgi:hypothetical protein